MQKTIRLDCLTHVDAKGVRVCRYLEMPTDQLYSYEVFRTIKT